MDIREYIRGFSIDLEARHRADSTIETYVKAVTQLVVFLEAEGRSTEVEAVGRDAIREHIAWLTGNRAPATAAQRFASLQQFFKWLVDEGEIDESPMARLKKPSVPDKPIPVLTDSQLRALLDACKGPAFEDVRDTAIVRLFVDTGARLSEIADRTLEDIDLDERHMVSVVKGRHTPLKYFGARTAQALDRYDRARRRHRHADLPWLWLSSKGRLSGSGITQMLRKRAKAAGVGHVHPLMFRHTFASRWLAEGGNEGDLQRLMGWKDRQMLGRYGSPTAQGRTRDEHKRMGLGDRL